MNEKFVKNEGNFVFVSFWGSFSSNNKTQLSTERGARASNFASFHSTMSVGVLMARNIYEFTVASKGAIFLFTRIGEKSFTLSNIFHEAGKAIFEV